MDYVPDSANIPTNNAFAVVGQLSMNYDFTLSRGFDQATCNVIVMVGRMSEKDAQSRLDGLLASSGVTSVKAAIESDKTLSGAVQTLRVVSAAPGTISSANIDYLSYQYSVELIG
jgi:uncharacterized protein YfaQ (DUF2300 family)